MAQSRPYSLLPLASDSSEGVTGFALAAASGGILCSAGGASFAFCAHRAKAKKNCHHYQKMSVCSKLDVEFLLRPHTSCFRSSVDLTTMLYVAEKEAGSQNRVRDESQGGLRGRDVWLGRRTQVCLLAWLAATPLCRLSPSGEAHYWRNPFIWNRLQKYYKQEYGLLVLSYSGLSPS